MAFREPNQGSDRETNEDQLYSKVYRELQKVASAKMVRESPGHTLQPTALVHEAWLRLGGDRQPKWNSKAHFFAAAAEAMRRILIDQARKKNTLKRGGSDIRITFERASQLASEEEENRQLIVLDEALERFAREQPRKAELVKLRYFVGLTFDEAAQTLGISKSTAKNWWKFSKAWLFEEMSPGKNR